MFSIISDWSVTLWVVLVSDIRILHVVTVHLGEARDVAGFRDRTTLCQASRSARLLKSPTAGTSGGKASVLRMREFILKAAPTCVV